MKVSVVGPSSLCQHFQTTSPLTDSFHISHIASIGRGNEKLCFCSNRIITMVAMATWSSHRLIMGKEEIDIFLSHWGYLEFFLQKCLLSRPLRFI